MEDTKQEAIEITEEHLVDMPETSAGPTPQKKSETEPLDLNTAKVGYIVALDKNNKVIFRPFGTDQNIATIAGIQDYAAKKVNALIDRTMVTGDGLTHEVGLAVNAIHQKLDGLSGFLMSKNQPAVTEE